jgi:PAS domain S-box-containing protein
MMRTFIKKLGAVRSAAFCTIFTVLSSLCLYTSISLILGDISLRGFNTAALIPAVITPLLSFRVFRIIIRLDASEQALMQSQERFNALYNRNLHCIFIHDFEGNFLDANDASLNLLGYRREEIPSINFASLIDEDQLPRAMRAISELKQNGTLQHFLEFKLKQKDGGTIWVETDSSVIYEGQAPYAILGVARDITARKEAVRALSESEENYRRLFDHAADVIAVISPEGEFLELNNRFEEESGYKKEEMLGQSVFASGLLVPESAKKVQYYLEEVLNGKPVPVFEVDAAFKDGQIVPFELNVVPIKRDGRILRILASLRNIAERKQSYEERHRLEAQLRQAQKLEAIGTLAGGIAHDFNNLLMAVQGNVSLALLESDPSDNFHELLKNIEQQVENGARLTSQLLGYARKGKYQTRIVDLNELVESTASTFARMRKDILIEQHLDPEWRRIKADRAQIEQVLLNIFINAADAMPEGGSLILESGIASHTDFDSKPYRPKPGRYIRLVITDTGVGMEKKIMDRIFDPFFTTKEMGRGTGLGLASVYGILKAHGGYIDVESEKGRGTTFIIYLPVSADESEKKLQPAAGSFGGDATILIVDDEKVVLEVGAKILKRLGYDVLEAGNGHHAIEIYKANADRIDLVILDVIMPGLSGAETFDELKRINPNVKVLLSSGYSMDGQAKRIMARGCDGFIQKPFNLQALADKLNELT